MKPPKKSRASSAPADVRPPSPSRLTSSKQVPEALASRRTARLRGSVGTVLAKSPSKARKPNKAARPVKASRPTRSAAAPVPQDEMAGILFLAVGLVVLLLAMRPEWMGGIAPAGEVATRFLGCGFAAFAAAVILVGLEAFYPHQPLALPQLVTALGFLLVCIEIWADLLGNSGGTVGAWLGGIMTEAVGRPGAWTLSIALALVDLQWMLRISLRGPARVLVLPLRLVWRALRAMRVSMAASYEAYEASRAYEPEESGEDVKVSIPGEPAAKATKSTRGGLVQAADFVAPVTAADPTARGTVPPVTRIVAAPAGPGPLAKAASFWKRVANGTLLSRDNLRAIVLPEPPGETSSSAAPASSAKPGEVPHLPGGETTSASASPASAPVQSASRPSAPSPGEAQSLASSTAIDFSSPARPPQGPSTGEGRPSTESEGRRSAEPARKTAEPVFPDYLEASNPRAEQGLDTASEGAGGAGDTYAPPSATLQTVHASTLEQGSQASSAVQANVGLSGRGGEEPSSGDSSGLVQGPAASTAPARPDSAPRPAVTVRAVPVASSLGGPSKRVQDETSQEWEFDDSADEVEDAEIPGYEEDESGVWVSSGDFAGEDESGEQSPWIVQARPQGASTPQDRAPWEDSAETSPAQEAFEDGAAQRPRVGLHSQHRSPGDTDGSEHRSTPSPAASHARFNDSLAGDASDDADSEDASYASSYDDGYDEGEAYDEDGERVQRAYSEHPATFASVNEFLEAAPARAPIEYNLPPVDFLSPGTPAPQADAESVDFSRVIVETLNSFGVATRIINVEKGPTVTRYELQPARGVKVSKITSLNNDIALALAAQSIRIEAPIPGKSAIGIEVPNSRVDAVPLREIVESHGFSNGKGLQLALGKDISGRPVVADLLRMPHLLIAGATGSGKSVCLNTVIVSLLYQATPKEVQLVMVDPKRVELSIFEGIPHLANTNSNRNQRIVKDAKGGTLVLKQACEIMNQRFELLSQNRVRNIAEYNAKASVPMPYLIIIVDELAQLMQISARSVEGYLQELAQMGRAAGIHLILATQRPSVDVLTGTIKSNFPARIAFAVSAQVDSRTILDRGGAEKLLGRGDMLFSPTDSELRRVQGALITLEETERIVDFWREQEVPDNLTPLSLEAKTTDDLLGGGGESGGEDEDLLREALRVIKDTKLASASNLQRKLQIGYPRAARLVDDLEARGFLGPANGSKPRKILFLESVE